LEPVPAFTLEEVDEIVGIKRKQKSERKAEAAERRSEKLGPLKCKLRSLNSEGAHYGRKGIRTVDLDLLFAFILKQQVEDCLSSLHTYLFRVVLPGTNVCVDETHFFRIMANLPSMLGLLQHIKGKPYDYGLVTYNGRGNLPLPPIETTLILLARLPNETSVHFGSQALIADSLWSHPAHLDRFRQHGIRYTVAVKDFFRV
jgi:hypothetical protein